MIQVNDFFCSSFPYFLFISSPQSFLSDISQGSTRRIRISQPNMPRNSGTDIPIGLNRASGSFASLSQDLDYPLTWKEKLEDCLDSKAMQVYLMTQKSPPPKRDKYLH